MTLTDLARAVEEAVGADRELDAMIAVAVNFHAEDSVPAAARKLHHDYGGSNSYADIGKYWPRLPAYTGSIEAALSLVPDDMLWMLTNTSIDGAAPDLSKATAVVGPWDECSGRDAVSAATPALALTAAALKSRTIATGGEG